MRGRRPTPTPIRVLEGNRGHRPIPQHEPRPRELAPRCPDWLSPVAKRHWRLLLTEFAYLPGLLTPLDGGVLAGLCESFAAWREATEFLHTHGPVYREGDQLRPTPHVKLARDAFASYLRCCAEIGATPAARTRIAVQAAGLDDDEIGLDRLGR